MESWIGIGIGVTIVNAVIWAYVASPFWPDPERRSRAAEEKTVRHRALKPGVPTVLPSALSMRTDRAQAHRT